MSSPLIDEIPITRIGDCEITQWGDRFWVYGPHAGSSRAWLNTYINFRWIHPTPIPEPVRQFVESYAALLR